MLPDKTVVETIETLTERLQTSTLLDDRRDACRGLRSLAKDYREICAKSMEALLLAIKIDRQDTEMVNYCLDSLNYIISGALGDSPAATWPWPDSEADQELLEQMQTNNSSYFNSHASSSSSASGGSVGGVGRTAANHYSTTPLSTNNQSSSANPTKPLQTSITNASSTNRSISTNNATGSSGSNAQIDHGRELAEIFLKKPDNVTTILDTIIDNDFKTRWVAVRLLCGLARENLPMVQDSILSFPLNMSRLTQLITDEQELIRNDALVLFVRLTKYNQNIQNLVAYENFFDKIMYIIEMEGYLDGTLAVVMDCLNILLNLMQINEPNQILFRESAHIQKLMPFFNNIQTIQWTNDKTDCLVSVLRIIDSMIVPTNTPDHVEACQLIMQRCGFLDKLCELLTATSMPIGVLSETMNTASDIVRGQLGPNANMVMQTSAMMPVLLLSMVKEMCQHQERRISDVDNRITELHKYIVHLHDYLCRNNLLNHDQLKQQQQ